jgi:hypothetical protein
VNSARTATPRKVGGGGPCSPCPGRTHRARSGRSRRLLLRSAKAPPTRFLVAPLERRRSSAPGRPRRHPDDRLSSKARARSRSPRTRATPRRAAVEPRDLTAAAVVIASHPDAGRRRAEPPRFTDAREPSLSRRARPSCPAKERVPIRAIQDRARYGADARRGVKAGRAAGLAPWFAAGSGRPMRWF